MAYIEPLDLQTILVNLVAGSMEIFILFAFIAIATIGAFFGLSNLAMMLMFILFSVIMSTYVSPIVLIVILIAGLITFKTIGKLVKN